MESTSGTGNTSESLWILPFGKHKGKEIESIPSSYLEWLTEQDWFCKQYKHGLEQIEKEMKFRDDFPEERSSELLDGPHDEDK